MKFLLQIIISIICLLSLFGCVAGKSGHLNSYVAAGFPAAYESLVAADLAKTLSGLYPPGHSSLYLNNAETDALGAALESALRQRGFTLSETPGGQTKTVTYVLDQLDDGFWYTRLTITGGPVVTKVFRENSGQLEALASAKADQGW